MLEALMTADGLEREAKGQRPRFVRHKGGYALADVVPRVWAHLVAVAVGSVSWASVVCLSNRIVGRGTTSLSWS